MPSIILNEILKILVLLSMLWSIFNLYLAIYYRVRSLKNKELIAVSKSRMKDFFEGLVFMFMFWVYIVSQVYLHGLGITDYGLKPGRNTVCLGIRFNSICLGRVEILEIKTNENDSTFSL